MRRSWTAATLTISQRPTAPACRPSHSCRRNADDNPPPSRTCVPSAAINCVTIGAVKMLLRRLLRRPSASAFWAGGVVENHRPILRADVRPLLVRRGRIVVRPEDVEQLPIRHPGRGSYRTCTVSACPVLVGANVLVSGVGQLPAHETDRRVDHAGNVPRKSPANPRSSPPRTPPSPPAAPLPPLHDRPRQRSARPSSGQ